MPVARVARESDPLPEIVGIVSVERQQHAARSTRCSADAVGKVVDVPGCALPGNQVPRLTSRDERKRAGFVARERNAAVKEKISSERLVLGKLS